MPTRSMSPIGKTAIGSCYDGLMLFLVDGYNVTKSDPATRDLSLEQQRHALAARLAASAGSVLGRGRVVAVFDAREQLGLTDEVHRGVAMVYAPDADTEIVARCARAGRQVTVVTSDMRLRMRISQDVGRWVVYRDASVMFAGATVSAPPPSARPAGDAGTPAHADEITKELEELWCKEDNE